MKLCDFLIEGQKATWKQTPGFILFPMRLFCYKTNFPNRRVRKTICYCQETRVEDRNLLIFGLGYLGKAIAMQLAKQGWNVTGTKRKLTMDKELMESGIEVIELDTESSGQLSETILQKLFWATCILISIPANHQGDPLLNKLEKQINLQSFPKHRIRWIGYISSTVIYEPSKLDNWIDEDAPLAEHMNKASYYISAEEQWRKWTKDSKIRLVIFRLSALYGPFRSALDTLIRIQLLHRNVEGFLQSSAFVGDVLVSRIHLTDACEKIIASMVVSESILFLNPCIINLSDDLPCTRSEVFYYALQLLDESTVNAWNALYLRREDKQLSIPFRESFTTSLQDVYKGIRTRIFDSKKGKRILNQRMKTLLGDYLHFPTYRQGLLHIKNDILIRYHSVFKG
ncbi:hypothetical protein GpartN1_g4404.t1 [Galdieria partita]|uniref:NAD-dependent epimerase/dehydratase domain-containing protein n=1 Tax=Galdieria partita TaxID=83374 RepID=A0A9C7PXA2_9RHOD|nr:hypothetical protein GpartN1_g4404.t1 [Galdieria partita]